MYAMPSALLKAGQCSCKFHKALYAMISFVDSCAWIFSEVGVTFVGLVYSVICIDKDSSGSRVANWCGTKRRFSWCGKRIAAALSCSQSIRTHPESADFGPTARSQDHHRSYVLYPHGSRSRPKPSPRRPIYTSGVKQHYPVYTYNLSHYPKLHWQECHV
jgi:hypothetical protein